MKQDDQPKKQKTSTEYYQENKERLRKLDYQRKQNKFLAKIEENNWVEGPDYITCKICGHKGKDLGTHIKSHGMNSKEYKEKFGDDSPIKCGEMCDNLKGENNPAFNHGGLFSPFSDNFIYAKDGYKEGVIAKAVKSRRENHNCSVDIEYWLKQANGDMDEAQRLLSDRQSTFSLEKCQEKYGASVGYNVWKSRQDRWLKTLSAKPDEEKEEINRKKTNLTSYSILWRNDANYDGLFYILKISSTVYKIGITTKSIRRRYSKSKGKYKVIFKYENKINQCFQIEQLIKKKFKPYSITKNEQIGEFGWTESFTFPSVERVTEYINNLIDKGILLETFKNEFNLKHADKFF